jgi:hypothetical protein
VLGAARAAGTLLGRPSLARGLLAHVAITGLWSAVLAATLPKHHPLVAGAVAGLAIAALDLGLIGRRYPAINALPEGPQVLDHLAFGVTAAAAISHRRRA